jgi:hypothetical protein
MLGMDLSFYGLGDGDHSSEPSLLSRGFLIGCNNDAIVINLIG